MSLIDGLITHTCTIKEPVITRQARGGDKALTYNTVATGVECVLDQASERAILAAAGRQINMTHVGIFYVAQKSNLKTNNIITDVTAIGDPTDIQKDDFGTAGMQPTQYRIVDPKQPNLETDHLEVSLEQMQGRPGAPQ